MNSLNSVVKKVLFVFYYYWVNFDNWLQTKPYYLLVGNGFKPLPSSLTFNSKSSLSPFPFGFFVFGKCCCTHLKWSDIAGSWLGEWSYFCFVSSLGWSRVSPHLFQAAIALVTARVLNFLFPAESKKMWPAGQSWSELTTEGNTVVCLSELVAPKKDGTTPIGWWLRLESQRLLFSWHGRFCQMNFFVSNIDV